MLGNAVGNASWDRPNPHFPRQMRRVFDFLDEAGARATFFMLGLTIKNYPEIAQEVVRRGDEVGSHGYGHEQVFTLTPEAFRADVERSIEMLVKHTGARPTGYRAPLFSINRDTVWALEILSELGFQYDSSLHDTPKVPRRVGGIPKAATELRLPSGA
ncbi:MAG: polysaccharide deacetylase family protein, partial [Polyangiaceae bacterium]